MDLGLPSGTIWAAMNVGASKPSDYGMYFQWGDTKGYTKEQIGKDKQFNRANYKWNPSGDGSTFTKYTTKGATLDLDDDAAHINMGGDWHMPSPEQINELLDNTTTASTTSDGVGGITFTSRNDLSKSIFIPAAGYALDGSLTLRESHGEVWTSMLMEEDVSYGYELYTEIKSDEQPEPVAGLDGNSRFNGLSVRGVIG